MRLDQISFATRRTLAVVLAGGRGSRLKGLTDYRAKPAVHFGGKYRIIDFTLSNCINSGLRRITVLTQYKSHSLLRHLERGWSFLRGEVNEFIDVIPAQQQLDETSWYSGTCNAVFQNTRILQNYQPQYVIVLAGDHVYKMDYGAMLVHHIESSADVTVACCPVPRTSSAAFGVVALGPDDRVVDFIEKPDRVPDTLCDDGNVNASMGIYIFNADFLYDQLARDHGDPTSSHDFGHDLIPYLVAGRARVIGHRFARSCVRADPNAEPYWRDVGTVDAYWEANLDLTTVTPALDLYDPEWRIFTYQEQLPPAKFVHDVGARRGLALTSLVSGGCVVSGAMIRESLLSSKTRVNSYATIMRSVLLPDVTVGRHARLTRCVVDSDCVIPEGLIVGENPEEDARRFYRSPGGITLVTPEALARLERSKPKRA